MTEKAASPSFFDTEDFKEKYNYDGGDLGAIITGDKTVFKLWAPTASRALLRLFTEGDGSEAYKEVDMTLGEKGVWSHTEPCGHGTYYTYSIEADGTAAEATDPYARAVGVNGKRGMVVDLSRTNPEGWENSSLENKIKSYSEAVIYELHVRDFSNKIKDSKYRGKYLAFCEGGLKNEHGVPVGIDYLKNLGITHVHLLPVFDFSTVDEASSEEQFNWGYDPENYNAPEGSYSTDPYHADVRIREFKEAVMALHRAGIGVITDMVYNHTYDMNGSLNKTAPGYFYRYDENGEATNASGCGNDTASERCMFGRYMVDSAAFWVREYKLDGLRFDLMGLHDLETMQKIESAVHKINPHAIIYGEGWEMGSTVDGSPQANQRNIGKIVPSGAAIGGIAVFCDVLRDGLKGSVFEKESQGYINGASDLSFSRVAFGIRGGKDTGHGWSLDNAMVINYMSAHDNNTLWDKLSLSNPDVGIDERVKMNKLGAAIIMLSRGTPFLQAGEEMLRTKGGDENSYKSGDEINNINWSALKEGSAEYSTMLYYRGLIEMRKHFPIFTDITEEITVEKQESGLMLIEYGKRALAAVNPHPFDIPCFLGEKWKLVADGERAGSRTLCLECGIVNVHARSVRVYVK